MEPEFWQERWRRSEIGFHQNEINAFLQQYWPLLCLDNAAEVFVPLCGKSRDMLWLRQLGHRVLGVELSEIAAENFFNENALTPTRMQQGKFVCRAAGGIRILCGDFFDLNASDLAQVRAVYDRAALVALPQEMRARYVQHLLKILPDATQVLLVTFDYPQQEMQGPPFAVSASEVESLFREHADIRLLAQQDVLAHNARFRERGVSRLQEQVFQLKLNRD